jgi:hypothetical protein
MSYTSTKSFGFHLHTSHIQAHQLRTYFSNFSVLVLRTTVQKMLNVMQHTQRNDSQSVKQSIDVYFNYLSD